MTECDPGGGCTNVLILLVAMLVICLIVLVGWAVFEWWST